MSAIVLYRAVVTVALLLMVVAALWTARLYLKALNDRAEYERVNGKPAALRGE